MTWGDGPRAHYHRGDPETGCFLIGAGLLGGLGFAAVALVVGIREIARLIGAL